MKPDQERLSGLRSPLGIARNADEPSQDPARSRSTIRDDCADYDEFEALERQARWAGIPWCGPVHVRRRSIEVEPGQRVSMLQWGDGEPTWVLLHGGFQNAHTWDTVAMALGGSGLALDLPGHGHSDWREDRDYGPRKCAEAVAVVVAAMAGSAAAIVGMSLGGLVGIRLAASRPDLVRRLALVDVTPGVSDRVRDMSTEERGPGLLANGPAVYATFDEMLAATAATLPLRPVESLRSGVRHNAKQLDDGRWAWRYDRPTWDSASPPGFTSLWDDVPTINVPVLLVRGEQSSHVHDDDIAEMRRHVPHIWLEDVAGAGHRVQSDRPVDLARLIETWLVSPVLGAQGATGETRPLPAE